jgi:hypothetical protein
LLQHQPDHRHGEGHRRPSPCLNLRLEKAQALGLAHFEGRTWGGWHHHVTLVSVAHAFCTLQRLARAPKDPAPA